jgi:antitoxin FitA
MMQWDLMASITIRNLDETVKRKLRLRAAQRNRSMEDEAMPTGNLANRIRRRVEPLGGIELELSPRSPTREPPSFH